MLWLFVPAYGALCYLVFLITFLYAVGFVMGFAVPKVIDSGISRPIVSSPLVNPGLLGLSSVQHSVIAGPAFGRSCTRLVPPSSGRSIDVLLSSAALALLSWHWRPMPSGVGSVAVELPGSASGWRTAKTAGAPRAKCRCRCADASTRALTNASGW